MIKSRHRSIVEISAAEVKSSEIIKVNRGKRSSGWKSKGLKEISAKMELVAAGSFEMRNQA